MFAQRPRAQWAPHIAFCLVLGSSGCVFDDTGIETFGSQDAALDKAAPAIDRSITDRSKSDDAAPKVDQRLLPDVGPGCDNSRCTYGCLGASRCKRLMPSNIDPRAFYTSATANLLLEGDVTIDTDSGLIDGALPEGVVYVTQIQRGDSQQRRAALLVLNSLNVAAGAHVQVIGSLPLVIYARDRVSIAGIIDVGARGEVPGPGGRPGGAKNGGLPTGCRNIAEGGFQVGSGLPLVPDTEGGGGGGGWGSAGGNGGTGKCGTVAGGSGGRGGAKDNDHRNLQPLVGGCGGAGGAGPDSNPDHGDGGPGGGGGGGIQISAHKSISILKDGGISAGGGGGASGGISAGGGGGGSGGSILLEADAVILDGLLAANGGGGGGGGHNDLSGIFVNEPGKDGTHGTDLTPGGASAFGGTAGGAGAAGNTLIIPGGPGIDSSDNTACNGGGGGGGHGLIVINSNTLPQGKTSPPFKTGALPPNPW